MREPFVEVNLRYNSFRSETGASPLRPYVGFRFIIITHILHVGLEDLEGILPSACVALLGRLPVDDIPNVVDIGGLAIEILEVVCVLPHVDAKERCVAHHDGLLVGERDDAQLTRAGLLDKPAPTATLDTQQGSAKGLFEVVEAAPGSLYGSDQLGGCFGLGFIRR